MANRGNKRTERTTRKVVENVTKYTAVQADNNKQTKENKNGY